MADGFPQVTIDAKQVIARFDRIPENVRNNLRRDIPGVTKQLASRVRDKLAPGALFKTTTRLLPAVKSVMIENVNTIIGRVFVDPSLFPAVVANTLESGSRAHIIAAKNAGALFFFWEKLGQNVMFKSVHHPGFEGRSFMQSSFQEMMPDIRDVLTRSVTEGAMT